MIANHAITNVLANDDELICDIEFKKKYEVCNSIIGRWLIQYAHLRPSQFKFVYYKISIWYDSSLIYSEEIPDETPGKWSDLVGRFSRLPKAITKYGETYKFFFRNERTETNFTVNSKCTVRYEKLKRKSFLSKLRSKLWQKN